MGKSYLTTFSRRNPCACDSGVLSTWLSCVVHLFRRTEVRGYLSIFKLAATALAFLSLALPQDELAKLYSEAQQAQAAGDLQTASRKYEAIVQLRPQMAEAYANLGNLYYQQGQSDRAKPAYEKAIHIKPDLAGPHFFLGVIAFGERDYASALRHLERAEGLEPSNN